MRVKDIFTREQIRWSDIGYGSIDGRWPAISLAHPTTAVSQIRKLNDGDVVLSVCAGVGADQRYKHKLTGISVPHYFVAKTVDLVEPAFFRETLQAHGGNRWPESIACRNLYRLKEPMPSIDTIVDDPRILTVTRGRYLASIRGISDLFDRIADCEIEELDLYRSPQYIRLSAQGRRGSYRRAGLSLPAVPAEMQDFLIQKVRAIFRSAEASGVVYQYEQPERVVHLDETTLIMFVLQLWNEQEGRCKYCRLPLETSGLAQATIDRINNDNREYGQHNIQLACLECNRGKREATHEAMLELWEKRKQVWQTPTIGGEASEPHGPSAYAARPGGV